VGAPDDADEFVFTGQVRRGSVEVRGSRRRLFG
jgi:hypothetical protein